MSKIRDAEGWELLTAARFVRARLIALVLTALLVGAVFTPASAQDLVIGEYKLEFGKVDLLRSESNSYTLRLTDATGGRPAKISLQSEELTGLAQHLSEAMDEVPDLPVRDTPEDYWGIEVGEANVWLGGANHSESGPLIVLASLKKGATPVRVGASPAGFRKLQQALLSIPSRETVLSRPDSVTIKGSYVQPIWDDGRIFISNQDAKTYLGLQDVKAPRIDLIEAAERAGCLLVWEGNALNLRRISAAYISAPLPPSENVPYVGYSSGYSSGSYSGSSGYSGYSSRSRGGPVHVRSYTRKDGTVVRAHTRSRPSRR